MSNEQIIYHDGHDVFAIGEVGIFGDYYIQCPTLGIFAKVNFENLTRMGWEYVCNL